MKYLKYLKQILFLFLVKIDPQASFYALRKVYFDGMVRRLNESTQFSWKNVSFPKTPDSFEDLTCLFFCTPLTRGVLRQDLDEAALLYSTLKSIKNPIGVEIGRYYGGSTVLIGTAIGERGKLFSYDISPKDNDTEIIKILKELGIENRINLNIQDANEVDFSGEIDFVFIDGDHSYEGARRDHNKWGKLVKKGGYIIHHDMGNSRNFSVQWNELKLLYNDIREIQKEFLSTVNEVGSMVVFRKDKSDWIDIPINIKLNNTNTSGISNTANTYLAGEKTGHLKK